MAMLVLSRKTEETIRIGDDIRVTIMRVKGGRVRIGVEAPHDMRILRGELKGSQASRQHESCGRPHQDEEVLISS